MSQTKVVPKRDLFSEITIKPIIRRKFTRSIPSRMTWKDEHGSWAVMKGIVKLTDDEK